MVQISNLVTDETKLKWTEKSTGTSLAELIFDDYANAATTMRVIHFEGLWEICVEQVTPSQVASPSRYYRGDKAQMLPLLEAAHLNMLFGGMYVEGHVRLALDAFDGALEVYKQLDGDHLWTVALGLAVARLNPDEKWHSLDWNYSTAGGVVAMIVDKDGTPDEVLSTLKQWSRGYY